MAHTASYDGLMSVSATGRSSLGAGAESSRGASGRAGASCPSLARALATLAAPFDPKALVAKQIRQQQIQQQRRASGEYHKPSSNQMAEVRRASLPPASSSGGGGLRALLDSKQRELDMLSSYTTKRDTEPESRVSPPQRHRARFEMDDSLAKMDAELDAEFGQLPTLYTRSQPGSKQASRRNSLTDQESSPGLAAGRPIRKEGEQSTPPQISSSLGSRIRSTTEMRRHLEAIPLDRRRSVESGGIRGETASSGGMLAAAPLHVVDRVPSIHAMTAHRRSSASLPPSPAVSPQLFARRTSFTPPSATLDRHVEAKVELRPTTQQQPSAATQPRGLKDIMGGAFVPTRPSTARPLAVTADQPRPPASASKAADPAPLKSARRPATAAPARPTPPTSQTKTKSPAHPPPRSTMHATRAVGATSSSSSSTSSSSAVFQHTTSPIPPAPKSAPPSSLLASRKLPEEEASDEEFERQLILEAVALEQAERQPPARRRRTLPSEADFTIPSAVDAAISHAASSSSGHSRSSSPFQPLHKVSQQDDRSAGSNSLSSLTPPPNRSALVDTEASKHQSTHSAAAATTLRPTPPKHPNPAQGSSAAQQSKIVLSPLAAHSTPPPFQTGTDDAVDEQQVSNGADGWSPDGRAIRRAAISLSPNRRRSLSHKLPSSPKASSRPRSSHHTHYHINATSTDAAISASSSSSAFATAVASSTRASQQDHVDSLLSLEAHVEDLAKTYNRLHHHGDTRASELVARSRELVRLVESSQQAEYEKAEGQAALTEQQAEWKDTTSQQEALDKENEGIACELKELHRRNLEDEKAMADFRVLGTQLATRIAAHTKRTQDAREETRLAVEETIRLREMMAKREAQYAANLSLQRQQLQMLEIERRARQAGDSSPPPPNSDDQRQLLLWSARMRTVQAETGVSDLLDLTRLLDGQPVARARTEADSREKQARLARLKAEHLSLVQLLGMKRMSTGALTLNRRSASREHPDSPASRVRQAVLNLAAIARTLERSVDSDPIDVGETSTNANSASQLLFRLDSSLQNLLAQQPPHLPL